MERIEIPLSRTKIYTLIILSLIFTLLGILLFLYPSKFVSIIMRNITFIRIVGVAGFLFFGLCSLFLLTKLRDKKSGLIIDDAGITDNSNATSIGLIKWDDVLSIEERQILENKFLIVQIKNPEQYIQRAKNIFAKTAMKMNYNKYGSPISITASALKIDFAELKKILKTAQSYQKQ